MADEEQREAGATTSERQTLVCRSLLSDERRGGEANPVTPTKSNKSSEMATFLLCIKALCESVLRNFKIATPNQLHGLFMMIIKESQVVNNNYDIVKELDKIIEFKYNHTHRVIG